MIYKKDSTVEMANKIGDCSKMLSESVGLWDIANEFVKEGGYVLEVGSWMGSSSYILAAVCANMGARLICVDNFDGSILRTGTPDDGSFFLNNIAQNLKGMPVSYLKMDSREAHKLLPDKFFDMIFIDADHTAPVVFEDVRNYYPKVKGGGVYCGHDYGMVVGGDVPPFSVTEAVDSIIGEIERVGSIWIKKV